MSQYAINNEILFAIDLQIAKNLYDSQRRIEKRHRKNYKNDMRHVGRFVNGLNCGEPYKRSGRARP